MAAAVVARRHAHRVRRERRRITTAIAICISRRLNGDPAQGDDRRDDERTRHGHRAAVVARRHAARLSAHRPAQLRGPVGRSTPSRTRSRCAVSDSMPAAMDKSAFVEPEFMHYAGPDGQQVPAWLFVPKNLDRTKKHPAIVWIHGDGVNQNYDGWHVQRNYAVYYSYSPVPAAAGLRRDRARLSRQHRLRPRVARRRLHGRRRQGRERRVDGGELFEDAAATWTRERVGVWGLSYGGFFTLIAVTDQPKLFRAAVDVAGVVDYAMYYEDPYHGGWTASRIGTPAAASRRSTRTRRRSRTSTGSSARCWCCTARPT